MGSKGTEYLADSPGQGLLEHNRAHLSWLDEVLARYPDLTIENCGSGGGRMEYAMLSHLQLQSSSDQEDYRLYPAIAVGESAAVLPEQLAIWSYQLANGDADAATFNLVNAMLFRIHQSGHLAELSPESFTQVKNGPANLQGKDSAPHRVRRALLSAWPAGHDGHCFPDLSRNALTAAATSLRYGACRATREFICRRRTRR